MRPILAITAGLLVTAIVAAGVTLAVLRFQARTNTQQVNLRNGVTITEDSAIVQAAAKARPAVVSVITQHQPTIVRGSGYLATTDGYIVTNINVIAGASGMTVLIPGDSKPHDARLVDYDCQTGVAVIKIDKVSGLPTLAFADPNALVQGQVIVAVGGPVEGGAVTPGYVSAMHRVTSARDPVNLGRTVEFSDTIQTNAAIDGGTSGGPLLNVGSQVIGIALAHFASRVRLHFLPPYCPDYNRIERVWQDLHSHVTRNHQCSGMTTLMGEVRYYLRKRNRRTLRTPNAYTAA